ncbi:MAG TPA: methyltransferase domain-containing protein [Acidobacteriaceae bacterium]|nr:methyltransferase domain-containing protein [Acidobacteriaceae bacterium]
MTNSPAPPAVACPCCLSSSATLWLRTRPLSASEPSYSLLRCESCTHVWLYPPLTAEQLAPFYDAVYHQAVTHAGEGDAERWGRLRRIVEQYKNGGAILDIGCSSGGFLSHLQGAAWQLAGIEASPDAAERARQNTGGRIVTGDIATAQLPPGAFDVITCYDVLEHLHQPRVVFENVARWLRPGGIFYIFVPNILSWEARLFQSFWYPLDLPRHLHFFSPTSLNALAGVAGLRTVQIATPPGNYLENNVSRILTWLARKASGKQVWIDIGGPANLVARVMRKAIRLTIEDGFGVAASACHAAPSLQAVFQKPQ